MDPQIASDWSNGIQLLHCEGYCLYRPQLAKEMMTAAKAAGALVSMDLASFEVGMLMILPLPTLVAIYVVHE